METPFQVKIEHKIGSTTVYILHVNIINSNTIKMLSFALNKKMVKSKKNKRDYLDLAKFRAPCPISNKMIIYDSLEDLLNRYKKFNINF